MTKINIPRGLEKFSSKFSSQDLNVLQVSSVQVEYESGETMIPLSFLNDLESRRNFYVLLSPPAAKQLADALHLAVDSYLDYSPELE